MACLKSASGPLPSGATTRVLHQVALRPLSVRLLVSTTAWWTELAHRRLCLLHRTPAATRTPTPPSLPESAPPEAMGFVKRCHPKRTLHPIALAPSRDDEHPIGAVLGHAAAEDSIIIIIYTENSDPRTEDDCHDRKPVDEVEFVLTWAQNLQSRTRPVAASCLDSHPPGSFPHHVGRSTTAGEAAAGRACSSPAAPAANGTAADWPKRCKRRAR